MSYSLKATPMFFSYSLVLLWTTRITADLLSGPRHNLRWQTSFHFVDIIICASKMSSFILHSFFDFTPMQPSLTLFNFFIRSILCNLVSLALWLEAAEHKLTKSFFFIKNFLRVDYPSWLRTLNLLSLQQRRIFFICVPFSNTTFASWTAMPPRILYFALLPIF